MKILKIALIVIFSLVGLVLLAAIFGPMLFKDEIVQRVKQEINSQVNADVDFEDVDVSLLRSFPDLSVRLDNLTIDGLDAFAGNRLLAMKGFQMDMNLMSVLSKSREPEIESITIDGADILLLGLADGQVNYDIMKEAPASPQEEQGDISLSLNKISISDSKFRYIDHAADLSLTLDGLNGTSKIKIDGQNYSTSNQLASSDVTYSQSGMSYLDGATIDTDTDLDINLDNLLLTLRDNTTKLNALSIVATGQVDINDDHQMIDIEYSAPRSEFAQFLSLMPAAYTQDFSDIRSSGALALSGSVKGRLDEKNLPAFVVDAKVTDGEFQYPGYEQDVTGINADLYVSGSGDLSDLLVKSEAFRLQIDGDPLEGKFSVADAMTDPRVIAALRGKLDLAKITKAYPMPGISAADGVLAIDAELDARQSDIMSGSYSDVLASGTAASDQLRITYDPYPMITAEKIDASLSPKSIKITTEQLRTDKSRGSLSMSLDNYLDYVLSDGEVKADVNARFARIDASEFLVESAGNTQISPETDTIMLSSNPLEKLSMTIDAVVDELLYEDYTLQNLTVRADLEQDNLQIKQGEMLLNGSDLIMTGSLQHLGAYYFDDATLTGDVSISGNKLDLNALMPSAEQSTTEENDAAEGYGVIPVPERVEIDVDANLGQVLYADYDLRKVNGSMSVQDETLYLEDVETTTMGGKMSLSGSYETSNPDEPRFSVKYDIKDMNFSKFFGTINTWDALLPIAKFVDGVFNSSLVLEGNLQDNLFPDLSTLSGKGFLQTLDGQLKNSKTLGKVADKLKLDRLKEVKIENTTNWLEVKNGTLEVKKFDAELEGIGFTIGGSHSLTQEMNYKVIASIPKEMLDGNAVGRSLNEGIGFITSEAQKRGLPLESGDSYLMQIDITGNVSNPQTNFTVLGTEDKNLKSFVDEKGQEIKNTITDTIRTTIDKEKEKIRSQADEKVNEVKDSVKTVINKQIDSARTKVEEEVKNKVKDTVTQVLTDELKDKTKDIFGEETKKEEEKIKEAIDDWNPFKKKKKKGDG